MDLFKFNFIIFDFPLGQVVHRAYFDNETEILTENYYQALA